MPDSDVDYAYQCGREAGRREWEAETARLKRALDHLRHSIDGDHVAFQVASEIAGDAWSPPKSKPRPEGIGGGITRYQKYNDLNRQALHGVCGTCRDKALFRAGAEAMREALKGLYEDTDLTIDFILGEPEAVSTDVLWAEYKKGGES